MPEFYYEAMDDLGQATRGLLLADSKEDLALQLAACELTVQNAEIAVPLAEEATASVVASPGEVRETLRVLSEATTNEKLRSQLQQFLTNSSANFAPIQASNFVSSLLIDCGKRGDALTALNPLIDFERDLGRVRKDAVGRFVYAYALLLMASCIFTATDVYIGATFRQMFREFQLKLPAMTQVMIQVGPVFWTLTVTLVAVPAAIFVARLLFKNQFWFDHGLDSVILWGPWRRWRYSAQALAYLSASLKSEIPLPQACEISADVLPRPFNAWQLRMLAQRTQSGASLAAACAAAKVHEMVIPFLLASERRSALPSGCMIAARLLLERCRRRRLFFAYFVESFAMVFVLVTAIAMFTSYLMPLFSLLNNLT